MIKGKSKTATAAKAKAKTKTAPKKLGKVVSVKELQTKAAEQATRIAQLEKEIVKLKGSQDYKAGKAALQAKVKSLQAQLVKMKAQHKTLTSNATQLHTFLQVATQRSSASDKKRKAQRPGKRVSKTGNTYWESRFNRSDITGAGI